MKSNTNVVHVKIHLHRGMVANAIQEHIFEINHKSMNYMKVIGRMILVDMDAEKVIPIKLLSRAESDKISNQRVASY